MRLEDPAGLVHFDLIGLDEPEATQSGGTEDVGKSMANPWILWNSVALGS